MSIGLLQKPLLSLILALILGAGNLCLAQASAQTQATTKTQPQQRIRTRINQENTKVISQDNQDAKTLQNLSFKLSLEQDSFRSANQSSDVTQTTLGMDLKLSPIEDVIVQIQPQAKFKAGFIRSLEESSAQEGALRLSTASILVFPNSIFTAEAGIINESERFTHLLLGDASFPASEIQLGTSQRMQNLQQLNFTNFFAFAHYAVPTSTSLSTQTENQEKTPSFQSAGLRFTTKTDDVRIDLNVATFRFVNLPTKVAYNSGLRGNSVESLNNTDHKFIYGFEGIAANTKLSYELNAFFAPRLKADYVKNNLAAKGNSQGYRLEVGNQFRLIRKNTIEIFGAYYRMEPDASVASYADSVSLTNSVGYEAGIHWKLNKRFGLSSSFGERAPIYLAPFREQEKTLSLKMETTYDAI